MNTVRYWITLIVSKLNGKGNKYVVKKMQNEGMHIGDGTCIFSNIAASEPYLVSVGSNCTISTNVSFVTHDASVGLYCGGRDVISDICGKISIGDNCFIGGQSVILYGVSIPDNTLIAAGSVVTKSIQESGCIVGGNPARIIGKIDSFLNKNKDYFLNLNGLSASERKRVILESGKLIKR